MKLIEVDIRRIIDNQWQTRRDLDPVHVEELAEDIKRNGLMQPPVGRIILNGKVLDYDVYGGPAATLEDEPDALVQLAVGHNRKASYYRLSKDDEAYLWMPMQIGKFTDEQMAKMAWAENARRKDLSPVEEAQAIQRAMDTFGWNQSQAAEHFGLNRSTVANKLRLLKLPAEILEKLHTGELSERQATALLPLYSLPTTVLVAAEEPPNTWTPTPARLVKLAMGGGSSDLLRKKVDDVIRGATADMADANFPADEEIGAGHDLVQSLRCHDCQLLIRHDGGVRCGDKGCFDVKRGLWRDQLLAVAKEKTGLPVANAPAWHTEMFGYSSAEHGAEIYEEGCPKGRLALFYQQWHPENYIQVKGAPGTIIVCNKGERGRCTCLEAKRKAEAAKDPYTQREQQLKDELQNTVVAPAEEALEKALMEKSEEAWILAASELFYGVEMKHTWQQVCRILAKQVIDRNLPYMSYPDIPAARAKIEVCLDQAGIQPDYPVPPTAESEFRRRLERIRNWVEGCEEAIPILPAVDGNLVNLEKLDEEFGELLEEWEGGEELAEELARLTDILEGIRDVLQEDPPHLVDFEDHHRNLLYTPPEDQNFRPERAAPATIKYVLAIVRHKPQNKVRVQALERHLRKLQVA